MGDVNFYLKAPEATGKCLIYLQFKYQGHRFKYSFGETIDPGKKLKNGDYEHWSVKKQRLKSSRHTTKDGKHSLNDLMDNLSEVLLSAYRRERAISGNPPKIKLKEALDEFFNQNSDNQDRPTLFKLIERFINNEISHKGEKKALNTLNKYKTAKSHLLEFQRLNKYPVDFETINLDFFYRYIDFLRTHRFEKVKGSHARAVPSEEGLSQNSIAKDIDVLKVFMNEAIDLGYTKNIGHKHKKFTASWVDVDSVYLTEKELLKLYHHDFTGNAKYEEVRDLFLFGSYTGLRFSDYSTVKPENILTIDGEQFLKIVTQKTGELVIIPCNPIVLNIFSKYAANANKLPKAPSLPKFNLWIKEACQAAGLTDTGRLVDDPGKELWECVSSHTCRRSFATNLYLEGFPTTEIRKITGHTTEKAFNKYIKVSKLDAARKLSLHHKKKDWSALLMRVA